MVSDDRIAAHALDGNGGDRVAVHSVDEIARAERRDRTLARGRGDWRVGRGARARRAAPRAGVANGVDAARRPVRTTGYHAAELSFAAALVAAAVRAGSAIDGRTAYGCATRAVVA